MGRPLARGPKRTEERAIRSLIRAGCGPDELRLIVSYLGEKSRNGEEWSAGLTEIADFARSIGPRAARDYFHSIGATGAVAELTGPRVLDFARSVDPHTAEWYFWAIWGTKSVGDLTHERVLRAVKFFRSINDAATIEYFLAIHETQACRELTSDRILSFAERIGSEAALEFFGALWETRAIEALTNSSVLSVVESLGPVAAKEYFLAVRETRAVSVLTDPDVLRFAQTIGESVAVEYFRAIRETKSPIPLTDANVRAFAESIGKGPATVYFLAIRSSRAVAPLTAERLLRAPGVIRAIGRDAALDYFLAAASAPAAAVESGAAGANGPPARGTVPVLTLLDFPRYDRYRWLGLVGLTVAFWTCTLPWIGRGVGTPLSASSIGLVAGVWVALLVGAYLLLGMMVERAGNEFVRRRRRLLNENGIRWHDCLSTDRRCAMCWANPLTHESGKYDNEHFCRCNHCGSAPS